MRRREFISLLGGTVVSWPLVARAQQPERMRHVSVLMAYAESDATRLWTKVFSESLQELGWIIGRNIQLDFHWPGPSQDRLQADATEMMRLNPDVLLAVTTPAVLALQHETRSIPIVFANVADPVGQGIIASFAKPGGNTTGFGAFEFSIGGKWVEVIKEIAPSVIQVGVIFNPETAPYYQSFLPFVETDCHTDPRFQSHCVHLGATSERIEYWRNCYSGRAFHKCQGSRYHDNCALTPTNCLPI
jgi:ABC-type uncharacterized transport system substrate-binding protein